MQKKKQIILAMKFSQGDTKLRFETPGEPCPLRPLATGLV